MKSSSDYKKGAKTTTDTTTKYQYNKTEYKKENIDEKEKSLIE